MRDLVLGTALLVLLSITLALPNLPGARVELAVTSAPRASARAGAGAGFTMCPVGSAWRPAADIGGPGDREAAVLHDGRIASLMSCWTEQPQVLLFGYEPIAYEAQDSSVAVLRVRPAGGYREIVLTGPVREKILILADHRIETIDVPEDLITRRPVSSASTR